MLKNVKWDKYCEVHNEHMEADYEDDDVGMDSSNDAAISAAIVPQTDSPIEPLKGDAKQRETLNSPKGQKLEENEEFSTDVCHQNSEHGGSKCKSWTHTLVNCSFQDSFCHLHPQESLKYFCLECAECTHSQPALCRRCIEEDHTPEICNGTILQIYRYMLNDIVRVSAIQQLYDVDGIQQYCANNHMAIHLRPRGPVNEPPKTHNVACAGQCGRFMKEGWQYCSLACKLLCSSGNFCNGMASSDASQKSNSSANELISAFPVDFGYKMNESVNTYSSNSAWSRRRSKLTPRSCQYGSKYVEPLEWFNATLRKGLQGAARRKLRSPARSIL